MRAYNPDLRAVDSLRLRFAALRGNPLFRPLLDAWDTAWERDDEYTCNDIETALLHALDESGLPRPPGICPVCDTAKAELRFEEECAECQQERKERQLRREQEPELDSATVRIYLGGLIGRNVQ